MRPLRLPPLPGLLCIVSSAVTAALFPAGPAVAGPNVAGPNVLLIMSDDMGFSDVGCYGGEIDTPVLDRLAAGGLRFTQFYNTARCCPTRASLLTGLYPHQAGMGHMTAASYSPYLEPGYRRDLNDRCRTVAEVLRPAGYATYMCGKWHVTAHEGPDGPRHNWPLQRGFDRFYGTIKGGGSFYDPTSLCRGNTYITCENDPEYEPETFYYTDAISDNAVKFLQEHRESAAEKPFLLYVSYTAPHWPMHALPEDIRKYQGRYGQGYEPIRKARHERLQRLGLVDPSWDLSPQAGDWESFRSGFNIEDESEAEKPHKAWEARCMEVYAAMIDRMDQGIGRIIEQLRRDGRLDDTLILYLHDNGGCAEAMGRSAPSQPYPSGLKPLSPEELQPRVAPPMQTRDGRPVRTGPDVMPGPADTYIAYGRNWANVSNTPFREYKHWVHEGGISSPLIVHWPKGIDARLNGGLVTTPAHLIDIMATCVDVGAAAYPTSVDGREITPMQGVSLRPAFAGREIDRGRPLYWEHEANCAVRDGKWKLVRYGDMRTGSTQPWELFDMVADRTEMHDVADDHPELVERMAEQWESWAGRSNVLPWPWGSGSDARRFELGPDAVLSRAQAPRVAGASFHVEVTLDGPAADGVLVAQGGAAEGWSLYVKDGTPTFTLRSGGVPTTVAGKQPIPTGFTKLRATVDRQGNVALRLDGRVVARAKAAKLIQRMPIDGLEVGRDGQGLVGNYDAENTYRGEIRQVVIEIDSGD